MQKDLEKRKRKKQITGHREKRRMFLLEVLYLFWFFLKTKEANNNLKRKYVCVCVCM